jgi:hypothetical protein
MRCFLSGVCSFVTYLISYQKTCLQRLVAGDLEQNDQVVFETVQKEISYEELKKNGKSIDNKNYMDPNVFGELLKEIKTEIRTMKF